MRVWLACLVSAVLACGCAAPQRSPQALWSALRGDGGEEPAARAAGDAAYDIDKVMAAARSPRPNLILLTPHRGLWESVPENTVEAVTLAAEAGFEIIEIDVRLDGEGHPWLMHDFALDRLTTGRGPLSAYRTATLASGEICLRDRRGEPSDFEIVDFDDFLVWYAGYLRDHSGRETLRGFVLVVDLKSPAGSDPNFDTVSGYAALKATWAAIQAAERRMNIALGRGVILKLKAREIPDPATLERDLGLKEDSDFHMMAVMHPDGANGDAGDRVLAEYFDKDYMVGFEAVMEYRGQPRAQAWIERLQRDGRTVPGFPGWNDYPEGVAFSSAGCCLSRNVDPANTSANLDYSGSFTYQLQVGANWLTADTAVFLDDYLRGLGLRDVDQLN